MSLSSPPHLSSLSNELLIEIISNLCPVDIYACRCTNRRLNMVIVNSDLIQYLMRTALSGVFDPLEPGLSLPDRLDALERWEIAWMEMDLREPNIIIDAPVYAESGFGPDRRCLSGQYFITCLEKADTSAAYSFLDIHRDARSPHIDAACWATLSVDPTTVTIPVLVFAFAPELDLAVAIGAGPASDHHSDTTLTISSLQFSTGDPHPLASQPKLACISGSTAFNLSVITVTIIGDYILYWVGAPHNPVQGSLCGIYLVAWKEGWVSELFTSLPGVHSLSLSILSEEIILLFRLREPALELCRLSNIHDREKASLETVCILYLPAFTTSTSLWRAVCFDGNPGHVLFSKNQQPHSSLHGRPNPSSSSGLSTQQPESNTNTCRHLHSVPADGVIVVLMHLKQLSGAFRTFDITVRRRTLLEFSNTQAQAGAAGTGTGTTLVVPWEKWGQNKTHILELNPFMRGSSLAGERRATVARALITLRDYNVFRVQRALKLFSGAEDPEGVRLECGSVVKVVKEPSVFRGGDWSCDDIETSLPYVETTAPCGPCSEIQMDKDNLVVLRRTFTEGRLTFKSYFHCF